MYEDTAHCKANMIIYWTLETPLRLRHIHYHWGHLEKKDTEYIYFLKWQYLSIKYNIGIILL